MVSLSPSWIHTSIPANFKDNRFVSVLLKIMKNKENASLFKDHLSWSDLFRY